jgi:hypothetical protein
LTEKLLRSISLKFIQPEQIKNLYAKASEIVGGKCNK